MLCSRRLKAEMMLLKKQNNAKVFDICDDRYISRQRGDKMLLTKREVIEQMVRQGMRGLELRRVVRAYMLWAKDAYK